MNLPTLIAEIEKEFDEKFTYGVLLSASSDLSAGKGRRFKNENQDSDKVKSFLKSSILRVLQEAREKTVVGEQICNHCDKCDIYLDYKDVHQCSEENCECHKPDFIRKQSLSLWSDFMGKLDK